MTGTSLVGRKLGRYSVLAHLGHGGMGVVYRARDESLRREVALKVLPDSVTRDEERRRRFLREARAAAAVTHPGIASIYEVAEEDGCLYLAMELVEGETLRSELAAGLFPVDVALGIAIDLSKAVARAHEKGLVHRDLKPENVMLTGDGLVKVLDFGLAKQLEQAEAELLTGETATLVTHEGQVMGTPAYMSPEQARGLAVDARTDVFALGVMLFEMFAGRRPFGGATVVDILAAIARDAPPDLRELRPDTPPEIAGVVVRCLAKDAADRFANAGELASALVGATHGAAVNGVPRREGAPVVPLESAPTELSHTTARESGPSRTRSSLRVAGSLVAAGILGLAAVTYVARTRRSSDAPASASSPAPVVSAAPTALTDLPMPSSAKPEALAAYKAALQLSRRGGALEDTLAALERALSLDPDLTAAHVAIVVETTLGSVDDRTRAHFRAAHAGRDRLTPRDRALLEAVEPTVLRQPSDWAGAARRLQPLAEQHPADAQIWFVYGRHEIKRGGTEAAIAAIDRATTLDPEYAAPVWVGAQFRAYLGRFAEAHAMLETCIGDNGGAAVGCRRQLQSLLETEGECERAEDNARQLIAANADAASAHFFLARALASRGKPIATVHEALRQREAMLPGGERKKGQLTDAVLLALLAGDFTAAEREARALSAHVEGSRFEVDHAWPARWLAEALTESGRAREAAEVAQAFLDRRAAWEPDPRGDDFAIAEDPTPVMLLAVRRAGKHPRAELVAWRDEWRLGWERKLSGSSRPFVWLHAWAATAEGTEDARTAVDELPKYLPLPEFRARTLVEGAVGQVFLLAGQKAEGLRWLTEGARKCAALTHPVEHVRIHLALGQAREREGDKEGACSAYGLVLRRWGAAKPRSITADVARERAKALGCAP
jgi:eukaryotic-like serine/threonine-protein kinase